MLAKKAKLTWTSIKTPAEMSGKYETSFYVDEKQTGALIDAIDKAWAEHKGSFKGQPQSLGYTYVEDESGVPTGEVKFKATQAPQSANGEYTFEVGCYDADAREIKKEDIPNIGNGTIGNIEFEIYPYIFKTNKGIKLNLKRIQILKLEEYGDSNPFEQEDGDFRTDEDNPFESDRPKGL